MRGRYRTHTLARLPKAEPGPLRLALLSPWATRCGIAEYSHKLLRAMVDAPEVALTVYCDDRTDSPPANALSSWTLGNNDSVPGVLEQCWQALRPGGRLIANAVTYLMIVAILSFWLLLIYLTHPHLFEPREDLGFGR